MDFSLPNPLRLGQHLTGAGSKDERLDASHSSDARHARRAPANQRRVLGRSLAPLDLWEKLGERVNFMGKHMEEFNIL